ncbi:lipid A deacylase LpxR family protein [Fulvivirga sp. M361]|uniref:lipid A deacylase LpxR family protein n=1 Tax=Fulvivirga sp. M361 TaxID=2594266 RepID=UPI001179CEA0|nr:lipid A deacylase LpxR family protein [Fulvivirga sp. M361]TRX60483.1 lipid A deacylase LpxR family protein [Fulvivirga sp. M361]
MKILPSCCCRLLLVGWLCTFTTPGEAQKSSGYNHEIQFSKDNDFFVWYANSDRYYTYGMELTYRHNPNERVRQKHFIKKLFNNLKELLIDYSIQIQAFTPSNYDSTDSRFRYDRPFAGYLNGQYSVNGRLKDANLNIEFNAGILGPAVRAGELQNEFHKIIGDEKIDGWENQIENQVGLHLVVDWRKPVLSSKLFGLILESRGSLGNVFLEGSQSARLIIGRHATVNHTILYGNSLRYTSSPEYFITVAGGASLVGYNATIQGGIFQDQVLPARDVNRIIGHLQFGACFSYHSVALTYRINHVRGAVEQAFDHKYGQLMFVKRF